MDNNNEKLNSIKSHIIEIISYEDSIKGALFQGKDSKSAAKLLSYLESIRKQLEIKLYEMTRADEDRSL